VNAPPLREVQLAIWKLLVAPEGAAPGLAELERRGELDRATLESWIAGDEKLDALGRVDVYANMYFYRLRDVLAEDFEKTVAVIGEKRWHDLITDFLLVHPSKHQSLRWLGEPLPAFLEGHRYGAEFPWVADLARLEWARADAFQAVDLPALDGAALAAVPPERWGEISFTPSASASLVRASWDVAALHDALDDGGEPFGPQERAQVLLVYRQHFAAVHEEISEDEVAALDALVGGKTFGEICETLAELSSADVETAAGRAAELLSGWLSRGLLCGFHLP
jgi:hypothetical protein